MKMDRKLLFRIALLVCVWIYSRYYLTSMVEGTYVTAGYNGQLGYGIPEFQDTLVLTQYGVFNSEYYGWGRYNISYDLKGTRINFIRYHEGLQFYMYRSYFVGPLSIRLDSDLSVAYRKID